MQSSYNIIKGGRVSSNSTYQIKIPDSVFKPKIIENSEKDLSKDAEKYAEDIIFNANKESQKIIESAKNEAEKIKKEAYDSAFKTGYSDGFKKGTEDGYKKTELLRKDAQDVLNEAHRISREYIEKQKDEIINLAIAIAERIIGYQADINDSVIKSIVYKSISSAVIKEQVIIRVNPVDYAVVDCMRDEISNIAGDNIIINIIKDNDIKRGGCRIDTAQSSVDATIDRQLQMIREALLG